MSIQRIWKLFIADKFPLVSNRISIPTSLLGPLAINASPHIKIAKLCTETATRSPTPPDGGFVTDFFISKCCMTENDVSKVLKLYKGLLHKPSQDLEEGLELLSECGLTNPQIRKTVLCNPRVFLYKSEKDLKSRPSYLRSIINKEDKPSQDLEEGLELLSECGLTTPAQIRKVVLMNLGIFLYKSKRDLKSRLSYLRSIINKEDMCKLVYNDSKILDLTEDKIKSAISVLQRLGIEGDALSKLLARTPRLLTYAEEKVMETFKVLEGLSFERGSKIFGYALHGLLGMGKEKIDRKLQLLSSLGFSEKQIYKLLYRMPGILGLSEEKLKRKVDFLVKSQGLPLDDIVKYSSQLTCNLETRIIPRYRVMEALKSMQLLKSERIPPYFVKYTDKKLLERYVNGNPEYSSVLRDIYYGERAVKGNS